MSGFGYTQVCVIILEAALTVGASLSSAKIYRNRNYYPMKQLSPLITLLQGFSFYVYQLMLVLSYFAVVQVTWEQCLNREEQKVGVMDEVIYLLLSFLYLFARGCCFTFTFAKSLRIILAFKGELLTNNFLTRICKSEKKMIIISFIYAFFSFPFPSIISTFNNGLQTICWLQVYENNYGLILYTSLIEEFITLILILKKKDHFRMNDKLLRFTLELQYIFMAWIATNCLLAEIFRLIKVIWFSCWIRSLFMFWFGLYQPLTHKEKNPAIYLTEDKIENFQDITNKQIKEFENQSTQCQTYFLQYLKYLDKNEEMQFKTAHQQYIQNEELFSIFERIEKQIHSGENHFHGGDKMFDILKSNKALEKHFYQKSTQDLEGELFIHFDNIFERMFKKTNAYINLKKYYNSNKILQENLSLLNIGLDQYQLLTIVQQHTINQ